MISAAQQTDKILKKLYVQSISYDELIEKVLHKELITRSRPTIKPIANKHLRGISRYGNRFHPIFKEWRMHSGMDFSAKAGTPIYATGDGKVVVSEYNSNGYGWVIVVDHGVANYHTLYAHLLQQGIETGAMVKRGQQIGLVGSTGTSTTPHVHYEVHKNGYRNRVDPIDYVYEGLSDEEYFQLVEQARSDESVFEDWLSSEHEL
jgi:murein DD-endopeptidase MepM/ murein hydrolase activator NlpD